MKISAVIHTYNRADLIGATLEAVLGQSRRPDEVIVMDDGSTDGTYDLLQRQFGDRIRLYRQDNAGCEAARARAVKKASGDWIALCDSDDIWREDHLATLEHMTTLVPTADMVFTNFAERGSAAVHSDKFASLDDGFWQGTTALEGDVVDLGRDSFPKFLRQNPVFPSAMMYRNSTCLSIGGIDEELNGVLGSDADLTRRLAIVGRIVCSRQITVDILKNGSNMSADDIRVNFGRIEILKRNLQAGGLFNPHKAAIRQAISDTACALMMSAFWVRDMDSFRQAAQEVHFRDRPTALKVRSLIAHMPSFARGAFFRLYRKTS